MAKVGACELLAVTLQHVCKCLFNSERGYPSRGCAQLRHIGNQQWLIDRPNTRWINANLNQLTTQGGKVGQGVAQSCTLSGSQIVDFTTLAVLGEEPIRTHDVAHISEVTNNIKVANFNT